MLKFLSRRLLHSAATIFVAVALVFIAVRLLPGNPLLSRFGQHPDAAQMEKLRAEYGWDKPIYIQMGDFFWQLATKGDLGKSVARPNQNVSTEIRRRIPATLELTLAAMMLAVPLGISAGILAAVWRNKLPDRLCMIAALAGVSVPVFFLGILLRELFTFLPTSGRMPAFVVDFEPVTHFYLLDALIQGRFSLFIQMISHLCLPAIVLSTVPMAIIARITRSSMLEVLSADFVRTAKAKGASLWRLVLRHAFPNAAVPVTNIAGLQVGMLLSGAVLTETVFDWPGLGTYIADAVAVNKDYVVVQACAIVIATIFVTINLLVDMLYVWLDPRVRLE